MNSIGHSLRHRSRWAAEKETKIEDTCILKTILGLGHSHDANVLRLMLEAVYIKEKYWSASTISSTPQYATPSKDSATPMSYKTPNASTFSGGEEKLDTSITITDMCGCTNNSATKIYSECEKVKAIGISSFLKSGKRRATCNAHRGVTHLKHSKAKEMKPHLAQPKNKRIFVWENVPLGIL
ncbi:hypothetical protein K470DRAFT_69801 [Piedraia hortae CBS 480.64]|uniref:Uncharacterized protein n=1 Tax=Piedraia hortae CBS 480.64 TaxID=1314780 RepID=A0A6A7BYX7_9PEZI|nr:hypothetical protein K470DRAFT_69801 [Piedraia hortae CBS 480.64]